jgi:hypothetical protein
VEVARIRECLKANGSDVEAEIAPPAKARAKAPAKRKRVARKRRSK